MKSRSLIYAAALAVLSGCATVDSNPQDSAVVAEVKHQPILRGQVLATSRGQVYLYIDRRDGPQPGQLFTAYRFVRTSPAKSKSKDFAPAYRKEATGTVQLTEIVDDYFAKGQITAGKAPAQALVELNP